MSGPSSPISGTEAYSATPNSSPRKGSCSGRTETRAAGCAGVSDRAAATAPAPLRSSRRPALQRGHDLGNALVGLGRARVDDDVVVAEAVDDIDEPAGAACSRYDRPVSARDPRAPPDRT